MKNLLILIQGCNTIQELDQLYKENIRDFESDEEAKDVLEYCSLKQYLADKIKEEKL